MNFLLGGQAEKMLLRSDSHNWPVITDNCVDLHLYDEYEIPEPLEIDYKVIADNLEYAMRKAGEILD